MLDRRRFGDVPAEVALRLLGRAIGRVGDEGPVELGKLETLFDAIQEGWAGRPGTKPRLRRTLAGALVGVEADAIRIERAPPRRSRQRRARQSRSPPE